MAPVSNNDIAVDEYFHPAACVYFGAASVAQRITLLHCIVWYIFEVVVSEKIYIWKRSAVIIVVFLTVVQCCFLILHIIIYWKRYLNITELLRRCCKLDYVRVTPWSSVVTCILCSIKFALLDSLDNHSLHRRLRWLLDTFLQIR